MPQATDLDMVLFTDLGQDALLYMKRIFAEMTPAARAEASSAMDSGVALEVRIRMRGRDQPVFSFHMVGDSGELKLHSTG